MTVYRIENSLNGDGPYQENPGSSALGNALNLHNGDRNHPAVHTLWYSQEYPPHAYYCAFASVEKLLSWFTSLELTLLHKSNYILVTYETTIFDQDEYQVIFHRKLSKKTGQYPITLLTQLP